MTRKYPNVPTLLSQAERSERQYVAARDAHDKLRAEYQEFKAAHEIRMADSLAALNDAIAKSSLLRSDVESVMRHNGNLPISNGMTVWLPPIQGCNVVQSHEALTPEMVELPEAMREDSELKPGHWYRLDYLGSAWHGRWVFFAEVRDGIARVQLDDCLIGKWETVPLSALKPIGGRR